MTPDAIDRVTWIATAVSAAAAVALTLLAVFLHFEIVRLARWKVVATTISIILSLLILGISALMIDVVVNALVKARTVDRSFYVIYVDPGPLQKLVPLAAIAATWFLASVVRRKPARSEISNSG